MTSNKKNSLLENTLIDCLDLYFDRLGDQKPHAVLSMVTEVVEKPTILYVLKKTDGNITKASQILGITRSTLRKKIIGYNINTVRNA